MLLAYLFILLSSVYSVVIYLAVLACKTNLFFDCMECDFFFFLVLVHRVGN